MIAKGGEHNGPPPTTRSDDDDDDDGNHGTCLALPWSFPMSEDRRSPTRTPGMDLHTDLSLTRWTHSATRTAMAITVDIGTVLWHSNDNTVGTVTTDVELSQQRLQYVLRNFV